MQVQIQTHIALALRSWCMQQTAVNAFERAHAFVRMNMCMKDESV